MADSLGVLSLFSGFGMLDEGARAGLEHLGIRSHVVAYVERESYAAAGLLARMEEASLEPAPIWCGDLGELELGRLAGRVVGITAGFPCQPWSVAGSQRGEDDERWLWPLIGNAIRALGEGLEFVFLENVRGLISGGGLAVVLAELAALGFHAEWDVLAAGDVGAAHQRERVFILAFRPERGLGVLRQPSGQNRLSIGRNRDMADATRGGGERSSLPAGSRNEGRGAGHAHRPGRQRILEIGEGDHRELVDTDSSRHERGEPAGDDRAEAGARPRREDAQRRCRELANRDSKGRRPEADANETRIAGMEPEDSARGSERGGDAERRLELGGIVLADAAAPRLSQRGREPGNPGEEFATVERGRAPLADANSEGREGREQRRSHEPGGAAQPCRPASELRDAPLFAPGPADGRWPEILAEFPELAPAIESNFCGVVDGMATRLDDCRADKLRGAGNGVVPLQAAIAFIHLAARAMSSK